jgi:hypothetical protein
MRLGPDANRVLDFFHGGGVGQAHLIERQAAANQMRVRIVEAGNDCAAPGVDDHRLRAAEPLNLAIGADADDLVAGDRDRFGEVGGTIR